MTDDRARAPIEVPAAKEHTATWIFLHGYADTGDGFVNLAHQFQAAKVLEHFKFVFPTAPFHHESLEYAWYSPTSPQSSEKEDEKGLLESVQRLNDLIDKEVENGIPPSRIVIGGFSQGCAISLLTIITSKRKLGAVVGLSGYLPLRDKVSDLSTDGGKDTPILICHGIRDMLVTLPTAEKAKEALESSGRKVEFKEYPIAHTTYGPELRDIYTWLEGHVP